MVNFSSVNLRILSPDGKTVLAELQTIDRVGQRTSQNIAKAGKVAMTDFGTHAAKTSRRVAGELAMIAHQGAISARSLKQVAIEASSAAFAFGPAGIIAGAVALTGLAIFNLFKRTRDQIEETRKKFEDEIAKMVNAGDNAQLLKRAQDVWRGTPAKEFQDGIEALQRVVRQGIFNEKADLDRVGVKNIKEAKKRLAELTAEFNQLQRAILNVNNTPLSIGKPLGITSSAVGGPAAGPDILEQLLGGGLPTPSKTGGSIGVARIADSVLAALQKVPPLPPLRMTAELERIMGLQDVADSIGASFGTTLAAAIGAGITAGIQGGGLAGGFQALTGAVLSSIGGMFTQIGVASLAGLQFMETIKNAIMAFAPGMGILAAVGLIGLGAVLSALGGSMGGKGRSFGGGGGGGGFSGSGSSGTIIDRGLINPLNGVVTSPGAITPRQSVNVYQTIIGTNDPKAQRDLHFMVQQAVARGA